MELSYAARPRLKSFIRFADGQQIMLVRDGGVNLTIPDAEGQVLMLLDLLDGNHTIPQVTEILAGHWPDLTLDDVAEGVSDLDAAGLLEDASATTELSEWQQERYFSNLAFFGTFANLKRSRYDYQTRLRRSHVLLLGVGGLGSTLLYNLAGLGVGHVTALDCDRVELKNFARQFLYSEADLGLPKLGRAIERARSFNSDMHLTPVERRVSSPQDISSLLPGVDLVLSAIDQPREVQEWVNQACVAAGVPFIAGGMQVARGVYYSIIPGRSGCLQCLYSLEDRNSVELPAPTQPERVNRGIGPVASLIGALVSLEATRYLTQFAPPISNGKLWLVDFATGEVGVGCEWARLPDCPVCGHLQVQCQIPGQQQVDFPSYRTEGAEYLAAEASR